MSIEYDKKQIHEKRLKTEGNDIYFNRFEEEESRNIINFDESSDLSEDVARLDNID